MNHHGNVQSIEDELSSAVLIDAHQPPADVVERIERLPIVGEPGVAEPGDLPPSEVPYHPKNALIKEWVPFYRYYSLNLLEDGAGHVVHPMALGRFLLLNAKTTRPDRILQGALSISHELPNGGLAWYYPKHFHVARMQGSRLKFSSISQGTILSGLTGMARAEAIDASYSRRAFEALLWPFEKGGVNLAGKAVLEMPSFGGAPEIILNGWLDAILHTRDYAAWSGDEEAMDFFHSNVAFLAQVLPNFDARDQRISRYSDLSPYRAKVTLARPEDVQTLQVLYRPKLAGLPCIKIPLRLASSDGKSSNYDNHIMRQNGKIAFVWLSMSRLYETVIVSSSAKMSVSIAKGTIDRKATTPGFKGDELVYEGILNGQLRSVTLPERDGFICGYPTNFSKTGEKNYYHTYHIVGLLLLVTSPNIDAAARSTFMEWALRWIDDYHHIEESEGLSFRGLNDMLADISANQSQAIYRDFDKLAADAKLMTR